MWSRLSTVVVVLAFATVQSQTKINLKMVLLQPNKSKQFNIGRDYTGEAGGDYTGDAHKIALKDARGKGLLNRLDVV